MTKLHLRRNPTWRLYRVNPVGPLQLIVDMGLNEIRCPAYELEVARTDVGHRVPDDFPEFGHDRRGVSVEQHFRGDLLPDSERIAVGRDNDGNEEKILPIARKGGSNLLLDSGDLCRIPVRHEQEGDRSLVFSEHLNELPEK